MLVTTISSLPCDGITVEQMTVDALAQRCREETKQFLQGRPYDDTWGRELMRRALVLRDERAWRVIYQQYHRQVGKWVQARLTIAVAESVLQTLIDDAFLKMQGTFTRHPEKFANYPTTAALLGLLRLCVERMVQDYIAKAQQEVNTIALDDLLSDQEAYAVDDHLTQGGWRTHTLAADDVVSTFFADDAQQELWAFLQRLLCDEKEQVVVNALFIEAQKPRQLYAERPDLFQSVDEINTIRERLKARLQRNHEFRTYLQQVSENAR